MIRCSLSLKKGSRQILFPLEFSAPAGAVTVVLGKNGSGKSSLLRSLAGVEPACSGKVWIQDQELSRLPAAQRARLVCRMPQRLPCPGVTVEELAAFGRQPYTGLSGRLSPRDRKIVEQALSDTGLAPLRRQRVDTLSGGQRQLAFFAMLLAQQTPALLLDEPGASLDAHCRRLLYRLLDRLRPDHAVVLVLHDLTDAMTLADRVAVLDQGRLVFQGSPQQFLSQGLPQSVFGLTPYPVPSPDGRSLTLFAPAP